MPSALALLLAAAPAKPSGGREREVVMSISLYPPMPTRPCRFCLCLQDGAVFADFDVDAQGRVFAVRVSFDGYGCCTTPESVGRMTAQDSQALLAMVAAGLLDVDAADRVLSQYFEENRQVIWEDALRDHGLL